MQLPQKASPSSIATYLRVNQLHQYLGSDAGVRDFLGKYYPGTHPTQIESIVRVCRGHRTKQTPLENKLQNSIFSHVPGIS